MTSNGMRRVRAAIACAAVLVGPVGPALAQEAQPAAVSLGDLELNLIGVTRGFFGEVTLTRGGQELDPGYFCGNCQTIFAGSPRAIEAADTYATLHIAGLPLYVVGLGLLVTPAIGMWTSEEFFVDDRPTGLWWGCFAGGFVVGMVGSFLMQGAPSWLSDAANAYNEDVFAAVRAGRTLPIGIGIAPQPGGAALAITGEM